jgi:hypothetical protein
VETAVRISAPVWSENIRGTIGKPLSNERLIDITEAARAWTLSVGKGIVKDVKCLILLDLCDFHPC